jgi:hypothetical protein
LGAANPANTSPAMEHVMTEPLLSHDATVPLIDSVLDLYESALPAPGNGA